MSEPLSMFKSTYSSEQNKEIKKIKEKYTQNKELSKYEQIKQLDASTKKRGTKITIILGIISSLILGTGMSILMLSNYFALGIIIGTIGLIGIAIMLPLYKTIIKKGQ